MRRIQRRVYLLYGPALLRCNSVNCDETHPTARPVAVRLFSVLPRCRIVKDCHCETSLTVTSLVTPILQAPLPALPRGTLPHCRAVHDQ